MEVRNIGLAFVWTKQQECNLRETIKIVKTICNDIERQNSLTKQSKETYREINFSWGKRLYIHVKWCSRKERSGTAWLPAGICQLKGVIRNTYKGSCPLCLGGEYVVHILLDCLETRNWRVKILNDKWLGMDKEVACGKNIKMHL